ncbi:MAG: NAD(P)-binding domain-containing protein, partial [Selenomonadaceae bacterium]|nr:NAD(P)-binding domain-containing protein [Selenomonadaceae bacterium]
MDEERFNKVFIGSGLIAELFLHALIRHKGESPEDFYIIGKNEDRCERLRKKYQIRATTNFNAFVSKAKVIVLAVDVDDLDDIPEIVNQFRDNVPPHALINSVTSKLRIAQIEKYFPNHPVMRLSLNFSMINGNSIGT